MVEKDTNENAKVIKLGYILGGLFRYTIIKTDHIILLQVSFYSCNYVSAIGKFTRYMRVLSRKCPNIVNTMRTFLYCGSQGEWTGMHVHEQ